MERIVAENNSYDLIVDYRHAFDKEEFLKKYTDYFYDYDYIVGDIAYSSLRLKGFYHHKNRKVKEYNDYSHLEDYLKKNCAVNCKYFVLKKVNE